MAPVIANLDMAAAWDGDEGGDWASDWRRYDRAVAVYHRALLERAAITRTAEVLDVGCGNGETTRAAAIAAREGSALGVDLSSRMLARALELTAAEGIANARFQHADAQVHDFGSQRFDVVVSRFGAMFFADREAAFTNLVGAMRQGGRLVLVAWQDVEIEPFDGPFWVGADAVDAFAFVRRTGMAEGCCKVSTTPIRPARSRHCSSRSSSTKPAKASCFVPQCG